MTHLLRAITPQIYIQRTKDEFGKLRTDTANKENFEFLLKNMGLDIDTAHRMFASKVINTGSIPFLT